MNENKSEFEDFIQTEVSNMKQEFVIFDLNSEKKYDKYKKYLHHNSQRVKNSQKAIYGQIKIRIEDDVLFGWKIYVDEIIAFIQNDISEMESKKMRSLNGSICSKLEVLSKAE